MICALLLLPTPPAADFTLLHYCSSEIYISRRTSIVSLSAPSTRSASIVLTHCSNALRMQQARSKYVSTQTDQLHRFELLELDRRARTCCQVDIDRTCSC